MMFQDLRVGCWFKFSSTDPYSFKKIGVDTYVYPLTQKVGKTDKTKEVIKIYE